MEMENPYMNSMKNKIKKKIKTAVKVITFNIIYIESFKIHKFFMLFFYHRAPQLNILV